MAWNDSNNQNPWGNNQNQRPPELDELINNLKNKFDNFFNKNDNKQNLSFGALGSILLLLAVIWLGSGFYIVDPAEKAVELRFGKFQRITSNGLNWHLPYPIETKEIINVGKIRTIAIGFRKGVNLRGIGFNGNVTSESLMLTKDLNIIDIKFAVQYRINNAKNYLFNIKNPDQTLREASESAIREVIGNNNMDYITNNRSIISGLIEDKLQILLNNYQVGLKVTSVNMQDAQPPEQVQAAYSDAVKAKEDNQRLINEAEAYANDIIPKARGLSSRILQEAAAYKAQVVAKAEGESKRFDKVRIEFEKAPKVTKQRLYLETMEGVFEKTTKVIMDSDSNSLMYLPLDKLLKNSSKEDSTTTQINNGNTKNKRDFRSLLRRRGAR
ncbi:HflK protein [hydrothermal vent metagenome]|uniref:HflK protein n=1 Tax=hydrothermal vent metagenome TaxID=652676 RepID=A0A1W1BMZ0_9ZZZZ